jgi:arylsulfatase
MAVHAAMVDRMDQGVGRIVSVLKTRRQLENTLILFLADNGASPEAYPTPGFDRPAHTRDGREIVYPPSKEVLPGPETTFFGIGPMWANVANTPFRRWKAEMYEGGICTPLLAHWPAGLTTQPGGVTHQPGHVMDIMATCLDVGGASYPRELDGRRITPMQGKSLLPIFRGQQRAGHDVLAWEHYGHRAIRHGDLKLVARSGGAWELYDLSQDRSELNNLAAQRPHEVRELSLRWDRWAKSHRVYPLPPSERRNQGNE